MNATDLGILRFLWDAAMRRTQTPAGASTTTDGAAGNRPGGPVEPPPEAPARPVTITPDVRDHLLHLVDELTGLAYQAGQFGHLATQAGAHDPCARSQHQDNQAHARDLQATYYAEIRAHLNGARP